MSLMAKQAICLFITTLITHHFQYLRSERALLLHEPPSQLDLMFLSLMPVHPSFAESCLFLNGEGLTLGGGWGVFRGIHSFPCMAV